MSVVVADRNGTIARRGVELQNHLKHQRVTNGVSSVVAFIMHTKEMCQSEALHLTMWKSRLAAHHFMASVRQHIGQMAHEL